MDSGQNDLEIEKHEFLINEKNNKLNAENAFIKWAHAVNSEEKLKNALLSDAMYIEGDISASEDNTAIMAHPPHKTSDLTFINWLDRFINSDKQALKLDFKNQLIIEKCLIELKKRESNIKAKIILNADILQGHKSAKNQINAEYFLKTCINYYPNAILSIGWTTNNSTTSTYTWSNIYEAFNIINRFDIKQSITYAVRVSWSLKSIYRLHWLKTFRSCTLTLWAHETDPLDTLESLLLFRKFFINSEIFYDLPLKYEKYIHESFNNLEIDNLLRNKNDELIKYYLNSNRNFQSELWNTYGNVYKSDHAALLNSYGATIISKKQYKANENADIIYELYAKYTLISKNSNGEVLEDDNSNAKMNIKSQLDDNDDSQDDNNESFITNSNSSSLTTNTTSCVRISLRSNDLNSNFNDKNSNGSINLYLYTNGVVQLKIGDHEIQEGNLHPSNNYEISITDVGKSQDIHIDLNSYDDSNTNKYSLQLLIGSKYYDNQKFFISFTLLSDQYAIGIDEFRIGDEVDDPHDENNEHANK